MTAVETFCESNQDYKRSFGFICAYLKHMIVFALDIFSLVS